MELGLFYTGSRLESGSAIAKLSQSLPDYMVPRWTWHLEKLPLNANQKVNRSALADLAAMKVSPE